MNERLKFSWGHIFAFAALIAVCYISFMGFTYLTDGNFIYGLIGMALTALAYLLVFIGAQQLKASGVRMSRKIVAERMLLLLSPLVFVAGMVSMAHFWTVHSQNDAVVAEFQKSINGSRQLFADYDSYAAARIAAYESRLDGIIARRTADPQAWAAAGFKAGKEEVQKHNMLEALRLQLLSPNYTDLKDLAVRWIDNADNGATVWNVFLIGNTREIKSALLSWNSELKKMSQKTLSNEGDAASFDSGCVADAVSGIDNIASIFTTRKAPVAEAVVFGIIVFLMLLLPYFLQARHTKSNYRLLGKRRDSFDDLAGVSATVSGSRKSDTSMDF